MRASFVAAFATMASADINTDFAGYLSGQYQTDVTPDQMFHEWNTIYESRSTHQSLEHRKGVFASTLERIISHNTDTSNTWTMGLNAHSDMTNEDFTAYYNIKVTEEQHCSATNTERVEASALGAVPHTWDWRNHNGVSPVKDQGQCGSCWTFSSVGCLEAHALIKYNEFTSLSEQQLVDCAGDYDNFGCDGGLPSHAFEYIKSSGGITTETSYPYMAVDQNCTVDATTYDLSVPEGSYNITSGDEEELAYHLFEHGPVSIAFEVVDDFMNYVSGVYTSTDCKNGPDDVNHAVLAVGYGTEDGMDYWVVKNSWGATWGDKGFFKIERGVNMCGVAVCNSYPIDVVRVSSSVFLQ